MKQYDYKYKNYKLDANRQETKHLHEMAEKYDMSPAKYLYRLLRSDMPAMKK